MKRRSGPCANHWRSIRGSPMPCDAARKSTGGSRAAARREGRSMIARLSGTLIEKAPGRAVVDVGGVGYEVTIPLSTYYELGEAGGRVELHIHTHVREETLALFGFR